MTTESNASGSALSAGLVIALAALVVIALLAGRWLDEVVLLESTGRVNSPVADVRSDYLMGVAWWALLLGVVVVWGTLVRFRGPLVTAWIFKGFVVLGPMLLYDYNYGVDPDGYYTNAISMGFSWNGFAFGFGTENMRMLAWLHVAALSRSFHASRLTFALLGLAGVYLMYRACVIFRGVEDRRLFLALVLTPSVLLWSSILGKDPVTLFGVCAYVYGVVAWQRRHNAAYLVWVFVGIAAAMLIRSWLGAILLMPLGALGVMTTRAPMRRAAYLVLAIGGIVLMPGILEREIGANTLRADEIIEATNANARSFTEGGSTQEVPELGSVSDVATFAPWSAFSVLFRPLPGEIPNAFGQLAGLENALLLVLALRALWRTRWRDLREPLLVWALLIIGLWSVAYGFGAYQNLGTANRLRVEIVPLLLVTILYLGRKRGAPQIVAVAQDVQRLRPLMSDSGHTA